MMDALVMAVAAMIAQTPYDAMRYNCWDYATDMAKALREDNITARIVTGTLDGSAHAWISVDGTWIEATNGEQIYDRTGYRFGYYSPPKSNPYKTGWLREHERKD